MSVSSSLDNVRAQYEALPYPPRDPRDEAIRLITGTPSHLLEVNHYLFSGRLNFVRPFLALPSMPIGEFDYIDCTGVLHHLPDPAAGMRALASVLEPDGGMGVMLY